MRERGAVLGVSAPNVNEWIMDIMKSGIPKDDQNHSKSSQNSCIIKLYDKNINAFKLNEQITFIGVLEFKIPEQQNQISSVSAGVEDMDIDGHTTGNQDLNAD